MTCPTSCDDNCETPCHANHYLPYQSAWHDPTTCPSGNGPLPQETQ